MTSTLRVEREGPVARVWLDRPDVRNALNGVLIRELAAAFAAFCAEDTGVRVIVLGGSGKAFCAGADLAFMREAAAYSWEQNRADAERLAAMLWSMYTCPVPVVARLHGDCYAGGLGLASVCDIRVAVPEATFCLSEARLGLLPATISPYVVRAMGDQAARRYFVTAERFSGAERDDHLAVERVADVGPVEPDARDRSGALDAQGLAHRCLPWACVTVVLVVESSRPRG